MLPGVRFDRSSIFSHPTPNNAGEDALKVSILTVVWDIYFVRGFNPVWNTFFCPCVCCSKFGIIYVLCISVGIFKCLDIRFRVSCIWCVYYNTRNKYTFSFLNGFHHESSVFAVKTINLYDNSCRVSNIVRHLGILICLTRPTPHFLFGASLFYTKCTTLVPACGVYNLFFL